MVIFICSLPQVELAHLTGCLDYRLARALSSMIIGHDIMGFALEAFLMTVIFICSLPKIELAHTHWLSGLSLGEGAVVDDHRARHHRLRVGRLLDNSDLHLSSPKLRWTRHAPAK
jgi:hypothetical protein